MIATIRSKKPVLIDTFTPGAKPTIIYATIELWNKTNTGYIAGGYYFHKLEIGYDDVVDGKVVKKTRTQDISIKGISRGFTNAEVDALFTALNVQYPEGAKFSEKDNLNIISGLFYLVGSEGYWGLGTDDWEVC